MKEESNIGLVSAAIVLGISWKTFESNVKSIQNLSIDFCMNCVQTFTHMHIAHMPKQRPERMDEIETIVKANAVQCCFIVDGAATTMK